MKRGERVVVKGVLNHCYQRTRKGVVLFYSVSDYLVHFTIFCTTARKYPIRVLSLCQMPDHIHSSVIAEDGEALAGFFRESSSLFSYQHNHTCHCSGALLEHPFGSAPKFGDKKIRTNLIYVGNNPVERHLAKRAEEYRWNYLAYAADPFAFSSKPTYRTSSFPLRQAIREVKATATRNVQMTYAQLQRLFRPLGLDERKQLVDFIISEYNVIDFKSAIRFFGSYEEMLIAMHATTGSEYDINEVSTGRSDACYAKMTAILMKKLGLKDIHDVLALPDSAKSDLFPLLLSLTGATPEQVAAFLRVTLMSSPEKGLPILNIK